MTNYGERFETALSFAARLHRDQRRKGSGSAYIGHLLGVTALVIEDGGDEDEAIAALLHDAVEDQGGLAMLAMIRAEYGERVAEIVAGCTDAFETPKPPWRERKEQYLAHLAQAPAEVVRVSLADKVYNAWAIAGDLRQKGAYLWERFNGGREGTLWYYRRLVEVFAGLNAGAMFFDLQKAVQEIDELVEIERRQEIS